MDEAGWLNNPECGFQRFQYQLRLVDQVEKCLETRNCSHISEITSTFRGNIEVAKVSAGRRSKKKGRYPAKKNCCSFGFCPNYLTYEKVTKNLARALPPPHLDKIQKNSSIFREIFPQMFYVQLFMSPSQSELVYTILLKLC